MVRIAFLLVVCPIISQKFRSRSYLNHLGEENWSNSFTTVLEYTYYIPYTIYQYNRILMVLGCDLCINCNDVYACSSICCNVMSQPPPFSLLGICKVLILSKIMMIKDHTQMHSACFSSLSLHMSINCNRYVIFEYEYHCPCQSWRKTHIIVRNPHIYGGYLFNAYSKLHHSPSLSKFHNVCILHYKEACRADSIENINFTLTK